MMDSLPNTSRATESNMLLAGALTGVPQETSSLSNSVSSQQMYLNFIHQALSGVAYSTPCSAADTSRSVYPSSGSFPSKNALADSNANAYNNFGLSLGGGYDLSHLARSDHSSLLFSSIGGSRSSSHDGKRSGGSSQKSSSSKSNRSPSRSNHHSTSQIADNGSTSNTAGSSSGGASSSSAGSHGCSSSLILPTNVVSYSRASNAAHSSRPTTSVTSSTSKSSSSSVSSSLAASTASTTASSYAPYHSSAPAGNFDLNSIQSLQRAGLLAQYYGYSDLYSTLATSNYKKLYTSSLESSAMPDISALQTILSRKTPTSSAIGDQPFKVSPPKAKPNGGSGSIKDVHETVNPVLPSASTITSLPSISVLSPNAAAVVSFSDKPKQSNSTSANQKISDKMHHFSNKALISESLVSYAREMHAQEDTKDIILTCEDKVSVPLHSGLMMAYCSSYVEMFEISKFCGNCVILLTDTKSKDVSDLVNALYNGKLPSDCSLTGVNYVAQLLGLKSFVSLLQRSLKDEINQSFLRRHNNENWTKTGHDSQGHITLPVVETPQKSFKTPDHREIGSNQENSIRNQATSENAEKRGTKRKSDACSTKFSEISQYRAKEPKLDNFSSFVSDSSPLNLSKTSSSSTTTSASDHISPPTVSNVTGTIDHTVEPNALLTELLSKYPTNINLLNSLFNPAAGALQNYSDAQLFLATAMNQPINALTVDQGNTTPTRPKTSSKTTATKTSKQPSASTTSATTAGSSVSDSADDLEKLENFNAWVTKNPQQYIASLCQGGDAASNAGYIALLQSLNPYGFGTASAQSVQDSDLDPYRDSTGALNLSADARDDSKTKKDSVKLDSPEAVSASSNQNSWASSAAASSAPAFTAASYASSEAASTVTGSYAPYSGFDYKTNGLIAASSINSGIGLSDLNKLLQSSSLKQIKKVAVDGDPNSVSVLPNEGLASSEDGMDDIIEVLADEDGSLLASYAGGQRRLLYHAGHGRRRKGCGTCENCLRSDDCGGCRYCADKAKFGGQNKLKQVCERKRCLLDVPQGVMQKSKTRCLSCKPCLLTEDCDECEKCIINKGLPPTAKKMMCESRLCEYLEMEDLRARNFTEEPSPYSTESVLTEAQAVVMAAAAAAVAGGGASNCPSPDDFAYFHGDKKARKMLKKKTKDGKSSSPKARTKYQCNTCWGCITTSPCQFCVYCRDMPKHGGTGKYRQKCVKQLCILHPRLQSNKINVLDPEAPLQCELEVVLDPFKDNFDAAAVTKVAMVNFLRLHHRQEGGDRERQTVKMLDILARRKQILAESSAGNDMDFKEERGETPDNPEYSSEPCRASGSTTASTPEPSDGGLAAYQSRHLPDLRPILGSTVPTSATMSSAAITNADMTAAYNAALSGVLAATTPMSDYASVMQMQQMIQQQCSTLAAASAATSINASTHANIKIDTVTIADTVQSEADVDVEQVESITENDLVVATDLSSQKKNTESEILSATDPEAIPLSSSSPAIVAPSDPEIAADQPKYLNEKQPASLVAAASATSLSQEEDYKETVEVFDAPAGDAKEEEPMELDEDKFTKQTSPRRGRGTRGKRSSENRGRTSRSRSQRRSPSPSSAGTVRTRAQSRELPPRRARAKTNSYAVDPFDHLDHSESDDVLEEVALAADQTTLEENGALVKGSSEDDEDTRSAAIQAAVQGVLDHELAEARITEDSQLHRSDYQSPQTDDPSSVVDETESGRWDIKTALTSLSEPLGNDANGNKTDASSAQAAKLYRLEQEVHEIQPLDVMERKLHQRDTAAGAEFSTGAVAPPPVPKLKLRLSNGPSRAIEKVENFDTNGLNS